MIRGGRTRWSLLLMLCVLVVVTGCGKKVMKSNAGSHQYAQSGEQVQPYGQMNSLATIMKDGLVDEESIQMGESTLHPIAGKSEILSENTEVSKVSGVQDHSLVNPYSSPQGRKGSIAKHPSDIISLSGNLTGPGGSFDRIREQDELNKNRNPENRPLQKGVTFSRGLRDVHFDFDSWRLSDTARETLEVNAEWLKTHPHEHVTIEGHCDERGTQSYNYVLGEKRATMVRQYLSFLGVPLNQLYVVSFGKDRPACRTMTADCFDQNRRAHFNSSVNMVSQ